MYLYNTTYKVDLAIVGDFIAYIKELLQNEENIDIYIRQYHIYKIEGVEERDGMTFCLHFLIKDLETFNTFVIVIDSKLKNQLRNKFGDSVLSFSTLMKQQ
jgi:hypothetical protein